MYSHGDNFVGLGSATVNDGNSKIHRQVVSVMPCRRFIWARARKCCAFTAPHYNRTSVGADTGAEKHYTRAHGYIRKIHLPNPMLFIRRVSYRRGRVRRIRARTYYYTRARARMTWFENGQQSNFNGNILLRSLHITFVTGIMAYEVRRINVCAIVVRRAHTFAAYRAVGIVRANRRRIRNRIDIIGQSFQSVPPQRRSSGFRYIRGRSSRRFTVIISCEHTRPYV